MIGLDSTVRLAAPGGAYPIWGNPEQTVYVEAWWAGAVVTIESGTHCAVDFRQYCPFVVVVPMADLVIAELTDEP